MFRDVCSAWLRTHSTDWHSLAMALEFPRTDEEGRTMGIAQALTAIGLLDRDTLAVRDGDTRTILRLGMKLDGVWSSSCLPSVDGLALAWQTLHRVGAGLSAAPPAALARGRDPRTIRPDVKKGLRFADATP